MLAKADLNKVQDLTIEHPNVEAYHCAIRVLYLDYSGGKINLHMEWNDMELRTQIISMPVS